MEYALHRSVGMKYGTGRSAPSSLEIMDVMRHRKRQLTALAKRAREHDEEMERLDGDLEKGEAHFDEMSEAERRFFFDDLRRRVESHE